VRFVDLNLHGTVKELHEHGRPVALVHFDNRSHKAVESPTGKAHLLADLIGTVRTRDNTFDLAGLEALTKPSGIRLS